MKVILQRTHDTPWQQLRQEWYGTIVEPPIEFRFRLTADSLIFSARRHAPALLHPAAHEGGFQENLWKYDTAEFFIVSAKGTPYLEFNLAPNGSWWAQAFTAPRIAAPNPPGIREGVTATGHADADGWACEARISLTCLEHLGISPGKTPVHLAATAIINSPAQLFLTTTADTEGNPDFHRPWTWEEAAVRHSFN